MMRLLEWIRPKPRIKALAPVLLDEIQSAPFPDKELERQTEQAWKDRLNLALEVRRQFDLFSPAATAANLKMGQDAIDLMGGGRKR